MAMTWYSSPELVNTYETPTYIEAVPPETLSLLADRANSPCPTTQIKSLEYKNIVKQSTSNNITNYVTMNNGRLKLASCRSLHVAIYKHKYLIQGAELHILEPILILTIVLIHGLHDNEDQITHPTQ
jgi:hypothetical protein